MLFIMSCFHFAHVDHILYYCVHCFCVFFFFKQKTAYEMRISDWSSDVCSSDLTMDQRRKSPLRHLVCENGERIVLGIARMHDQWQAGFARNADVGRKSVV